MSLKDKIKTLETRMQRIEVAIWTIAAINGVKLGSEIVTIFWGTIF